MPSVNELRKHVFDDALDLAAITGLIAPIAEITNVTGMAVAVDPVGFLRRQLVLIMALLVVRMHEPPGDGGTGTTASIEALLQAAAQAGRLKQDFAADCIKELEDLRIEYDEGSDNFAELRRFRTAELAHSLHRHTQPIDGLMLAPLWHLAHETFEIVASLERYLDETGMDGMLLQNRFELWREHGLKFWAAVLPNEDLEG